MAANRVNYIVFYTTDSQVYGTATKEVALETAPPAGVSLEDKRVLFVTFEPDADRLSVYPLEQKEILEANIKQRKSKKKDIDS